MKRVKVCVVLEIDGGTLEEAFSAVNLALNDGVFQDTIEDASVEDIEPRLTVTCAVACSCPPELDTEETSA